MALKKTTEQFIKEAVATHGDRYDYSNTEYTNAQTKVKIVCRTHGEFNIKPGNHISGSKSGCPECSASLVKEAAARGRATQQQQFKNPERREEHARKCRDALRSAVSPDESRRYGAKGADLARCKASGAKGGHKVMENRAADPEYDRRFLEKLAANTNVSSSKGEDEIAAYIESLGFSVVRNTARVIPPHHIDVYIPEANIGIEFNGVWWHNDNRLSEPKRCRSISEARRYHATKTTKATSTGCRLLHITDEDWATRREQLESIIRSALGVQTGPRLNARDCKTEEVSSAEAGTFLDKNHIQGRTTAATIRVGLRHKDYGLVAIMTFARGANLRGPAREGKEAPWNLTRFATSHTVRGGASKLFKYATQTHKMEVVESYSMNDWFIGSTYPKLGFVKGHDVPPDYRVYHKKTGFRPKSHWQRRNIQKMLDLIGANDSFDASSDPRTEHEVQDSVLALRIWDSGKILWRWSRG